MDFDLSLFEPFMGKTPYRVVSHHSHDQLVALQVMARHPQTGVKGNSVLYGIARRATLSGHQNIRLLCLAIRRL